MWRWMMGMYGFPGWGGWGRGRGWGGNPYPFCRLFPWLPRGWRWMYPYFMYPNPFSPYSPETELQFLKERERMIQEELEWIKKRIKEIEGGGE